MERQHAMIYNVPQVRAGCVHTRAKCYAAVNAAVHCSEKGTVGTKYVYMSQLKDPEIDFLPSYSMLICNDTTKTILV